MRKKYKVSIEQSYHHITLYMDTFEEVSIFADAFLKATENTGECSVEIELTKESEEKEQEEE